jgi:hypothetical protein
MLLKMNEEKKELLRRTLAIWCGQTGMSWNNRQWTWSEGFGCFVYPHNYHECPREFILLDRFVCNGRKLSWQ